MKTTHKTKKKASAHKHHASMKSETHRSENINSDFKDWSSAVSNRFISHYAIPFTRLVEAKLISLQSKG